MKYGACTWTFGDAPLREVVERLAGMGYDGIELAGDLERLKTDEVKGVVEDCGMRIFSLTPDNVDPAHPDRAVREQAEYYYNRLLDFAAELGAPIVCCHGAVGRVRALSRMEEEKAFYLQAVRRIGHRAEERGLRVALEVLNRYESHLLNTAREAVRFVEEVGSPNVGVLLDAFHMNLEENDLTAAVRTAASHMILFHAADSNRQAVGRGHTDFAGLMNTMKAIGYKGPVIVECTAAGPDPFTPVKGSGWLEEVFGYADASIRALRLLEERTKK